MKKLLFLLPLLALPLLWAFKPAPIPTTTRWTEAACTCYPGTTVPLPTAANTVTAVRITMQLRADWMVAWENTSPYDADIFYSWDYSKESRWPYPSELGTPGGTNWILTATIDGEEIAVLRHRLDIGRNSQTSYDGITDCGGQSGWTSDPHETDGWITVTNTITDPDVIDAVKNGADLLLTGEYWHFSSFTGGSAYEYADNDAFTQGSVTFIE